MASHLLHALAGDPETAALLSDAAELAAMLRVEGALALACAEAGLVAPEAAEAVARVCAGFAPDWDALAAGLARDGVVVPELVAQLRRAVGPDFARAVHLGATSQDVVDTGLVLRLGAMLPLLDGRLVRLEAGFATLAARFGRTALMAHTRMQQALPITAGDKIAAWAGPLPRHRARLAGLAPRLLVLQLGGAVGTRDFYGDKAEAVAAALARRLELGLAPSWHSQRDTIGELGAVLALVAGTLGKFGQDVALLAQNEVGALRVAGGGGSSAMAHKSNPVKAEVLVALARQAAGLSGTLQQALVHENERSGAAWTLEWLTLPPLLLACGASLRLAEALLEQISFVDG